MDNVTKKTFFIIYKINMKQQITIIILITFGLISYSANAQTELIYDDGVYQSGIKLTAKEVKELMKGDSVALSKYKSGRIKYITGKSIFYTFTVPAGLGLVLIIASIGENSELGQSILIGLGVVGMLGGGLGMLVGYGTYYDGANRMKEAVKIYNRNINNKKVSVNFGFTGNGVGLSIGF